MITKKSITSLLAGLILLFNSQLANSCSTYKVTASGKTMVGSNYDTWFETPRIWFETNGYGTAFSGARLDGKFGFAPQTGMNEFGLAFVTLATATPENGTPASGKKQIAVRTNYLKDILHTCKTVDEVKAYVDQYDHSSLSHDVFLYVDKTGKYLVVEPYTVMLGNDPTYVLANFCPSTVADFSTIKQVRYINGTLFLKNKIDSSLAFCTSLSDTMHVCRKKHGDGTLLTSILDLNNGNTYLYFYHDYKHLVKLNLKEELAKGNHPVEITSLFAPNEEFKKLTDFKTPLNSPALDLFLRFCFGLFFISAFFFLFSYFKKRTTSKYAYIKLLLFPLNLIMLCYVFTLARIENIFYFPAPYTDGNFSLVSLSSYIPFLILLLIIPLAIINRKIIKLSAWSFFPKWLFTINNISYLTMIALFAYWGLYSVFN
jgi:hypothetical protein